jgi:hypothetical protein
MVLAAHIVFFHLVIENDSFRMGTPSSDFANLLAERVMCAAAGAMNKSDLASSGFCQSLEHRKHWCNTSASAYQRHGTNACLVQYKVTKRGMHQQSVSNIYMVM